MRTSGSEGGRRKPTRENADRAPPADPTPACRPGRGSAARPSSRGLYAPAASSAGPPAAARGADNAAGALEQATRRRKHRNGGDPRGPGPPQRPRIQVTCPSPTPDDSSTRAPVASAGAVGSSLRRRRRPGPGQVLQARGPFWRDGPWKDRDDLETATAQWVNWYNRTRPHRANPDDLSPAAAEHRYHRNHTTTTAAPPATA